MHWSSETIPDKENNHGQSTYKMDVHKPEMVLLDLCILLTKDQKQHDVKGRATAVLGSANYSYGGNQGPFSNT